MTNVDATSGLFGVDVLQANIETTMSEPTLYPLDELVRAANVQHVPTSLKLLLKEAVPVEPDYEAAKEMLLYRLDVYEVEDDYPNETMLADDVRAIVGAALGIGGDDE